MKEALPEQDNAPRTLIVSVTDLIEALQEADFEEGRKLAVSLDYPCYDSITLYFFAQGEEMECLSERVRSS